MTDEQQARVVECAIRGELMVCSNKRGDGWTCGRRYTKWCIGWRGKYCPRCMIQALQVRVSAGDVLTLEFARRAEAEQPNLNDE